jgi:hypothetical protein
METAMSDEPPIHVETTVLPDTPDRHLIGWKIYEQSFEETHDEFIRRTCETEEDYQRTIHRQSVERSVETDWADNPEGFPDRAQAGCYTSIPVLEFLWGLPWNNLARNFVTALRPSRIRVTDGPITLDAVKWRVTVYLEEDSRTIRRISQEVGISAWGAWSGGELSQQLAYEKQHGTLEGYDRGDGRPKCYCNTEAISKLKINLSEETS